MNLNSQTSGLEKDAGDILLHRSHRYLDKDEGKHMSFRGYPPVFLIATSTSVSETICGAFMFCKATSKEVLAHRYLEQVAARKQHLQFFLGRMRDCRTY